MLLHLSREHLGENMVDVTLNTISSGYNRTKINENFTLIDTALGTALSKSDSSGNSMAIDLDMNGNDIINVGNVILATGTSTYIANNVAISGGAINNTVIGATTPVAGSFTTISTTGTATFASMSLGTSLVFEGATPDDFETTLFVTDPTADRTITLPDATGTVLLSTNIGTTVQGYDADTALLDVAQNWSAAQNLQDNELIRPKIKDYGEVVNIIGSVGGGTQDIDLTLGNVVTLTVDTSTTTFTFSNPPATGSAGALTIIMTNGGSQTLNWPAGVDWAGGTEPSWTASGIDVASFLTVDGGTTWYGFLGGLAFA
jgi:hypothetical protein